MKEPRVIHLSPWDIEFELEEDSTNKFRLIFNGCPPTGSTPYRIVIHLDLWWASHIGERIIDAVRGLKERMAEMVAAVDRKFKL